MVEAVGPQQIYCSLTKELVGNQQELIAFCEGSIGQKQTLVVRLNYKLSLYEDEWSKQRLGPTEKVRYEGFVQNLQDNHYVEVELRYFP